jgi:hypothetical protein
MKSNKTIPKTDINQEKEYKPISLLSNPIETLSTLIVILSEQLAKFIKFLFGHKSLIILLIGYIGLSVFEGKHTEVLNE